MANSTAAIQDKAHVVVWIDHHEARVLCFGAGKLNKTTIRSDRSGRNAGDDHKYLHAVASASADAGAILVVGPDSAKSALADYLHSQDPETAADIETGAKMSDGQLLAHARAHFHAADRMSVPPRPVESSDTGRRR